MVQGAAGQRRDSFLPGGSPVLQTAHVSAQVLGGSQADAIPSLSVRLASPAHGPEASASRLLPLEKRWIFPKLLPGRLPYSSGHPPCRAGAWERTAGLQQGLRSTDGHGGAEEQRKGTLPWDDPGVSAQPTTGPHLPPRDMGLAMSGPQGLTGPLLLPPRAPGPQCTPQQLQGQRQSPLGAGTVGSGSSRAGVSAAWAGLGF